MSFTGEGLTGHIATRIATGVGGIGRRSTMLAGLQAGLTTGTEIVEPVMARRDNPLSRWSGIAGRRTAPHTHVYPAARSLAAPPKRRILIRAAWPAAASPTRDSCRRGEPRTGARLARRA